MDALVIQTATTVGAQADAASIWARATDARDSRTVPTDPAAKLEGIQERLRSPGATLHLARCGEVAEGFALLVPRGSEMELVYLAVDPAAWGRQTATALLAYVVTFTSDRRLEAVDLWVLSDNHRAIKTYTRAGWSPTGQEQLKDGRSELQMTLPLRPEV